tara:strand:- start:750 stop:1895 length:1146 start_codon:yes stop_codon:yes gene_type:complete
MITLDIIYLFISKMAYKLNIFTEDDHNTHLINLCKKNGIVFIKMCQIMTSAFGKKAKRELGNNLFKKMSILQDACHQDNPIHLPGINYIDKNPIASGSVAQVYKINYNNKVSALKILLPGINASIQNSIKLFASFRSCLYYINRNLYSNFCLYDLDEYFKFLTIQTRLDQEAENLKKFSSIFSNCDKIIIPDIYYYDSTKIIMSYEEGMTLTVLEKRHPDKYNEALFLIVAFFFKNFKNNIMHGDFHLGNYLFRIENDILKLIVLDFGIITPIPDSLKNGVISIFTDLTLTEDDRTNLSLQIMADNGIVMKPGARINIFNFDPDNTAVLDDNVDFNKSKIPIDLISLGLIFPAVTELIHDITMDQFLIKLMDFLYKHSLLD